MLQVRNLKNWINKIKRSRLRISHRTKLSFSANIVINNNYYIDDDVY